MTGRSSTSSTVLAVVAILATFMPHPALGRRYYEVQQPKLNGIWNWSLAFETAPFKYNNFINAHAAVDSSITAGNYSSIVAGDSNWIAADFASIGGGKKNSASGRFSTVRGGIRNTAKGDYATLGGGAVNKIHSNYGTVLGGYKNVVMGRFGSVLGGVKNSANGRFSLAAGTQARALFDYSAAFSFNGGDECVAPDEKTVKFCAKYVSFGNGDGPTELTKVLAAVDKSRRLASYDDVETSLGRSAVKLQELQQKITDRAAVLDAVLKTM